MLDKLAEHDGLSCTWGAVATAAQSPTGQEPEIKTIEPMHFAFILMWTDTMLKMHKRVH